MSSGSLSGSSPQAARQKHNAAAVSNPDARLAASVKKEWFTYS
jgi:hypothetical protein